MHYIHLSDNSYIVKTAMGLSTLDRKSFNFNKIKDLINKGSTETEILPLLKAPELPNGIYEAYLIPEEDKVAIKNTIEVEGHTTFSVFWLSEPQGNTVRHFKESKTKFLGVYSSMEEVTQDWPEYAL